MARASDVVERMARAAQRQGYTRPEALQAIALACDHMLERYAGAASLNLAFVRAIRGEAERKYRTSLPDNVLPMRGQAHERG